MKKLTLPFNQGSHKIIVKYWRTIPESLMNLPSNFNYNSSYLLLYLIDIIVL